MIDISFSMPWGAVWQYKMDTVPRLGEHVAFQDVVYLVIEVRHFPASNSAWLSLGTT
jgi:hypothetical protein